MPYTATTITALALELAVALGDSGEVFFLDAELRNYLRESLRTWNCLATYFRGRKQFSTINGFFNYDLRNPIGLDPNPIVIVPIDQGPVTNDIQYALMEPPTDFSGGYTSSFATTLMYEDNEIDAAVLQAIAKWNFDTGQVVQAESPLMIPSPPNVTVNLPETVCDVRHVQLREYSAGSPIRRFSIRRQDEFSSSTFGSPLSLVNPGRPNGYSIILANTQPALRLVPPSNIIGEVEIVSVRSTNLPPQDWIWAIKWLALYFLLTQDGQCRDYYRAGYCKKRYDDAVSLARLVPSVLQASINGIPVSVTTTPSELDAHAPLWQNRTPGTPRDVILHGWNLVTLSPTPTSTPASITLDMSLSAPTDPGLDDTPLQLAQEHKQPILDYAKHLALFKMGGAEFGASMPHWENLFMAAMEYNSKLSIESANFWVMRDRAAKEKEQRYLRRRDPVSSDSTVPGGLQ